MTFYTYEASPLGTLMLTSDGDSLTGLYMDAQKHSRSIEADWVQSEGASLFAEVCRQLSAYFAGTLLQFDLPIALTGTEFQRRVWAELLPIPFGHTTSYGAIARRLDAPNACRAVGMAVGYNPVGIIVPCHRVVASNGKLTGYAGGLERKKMLLALESGAASRVETFPSLFSPQ